MKILIYGINFSPELTGIGKYTGEMTDWMHNNGVDVRVITAPPYYPEWKVAKGYRKYWFANVNNGYPVSRCPLYVPQKKSTLKRVLHLLSFGITSFFSLLRHISWKPDCVICIVPTMLSFPGAYFFKKITGAKIVMHIQDFEVDAMFGLGMAKSNFLAIIAKKFESWCLLKSDLVSTISSSMMNSTIKKGVSESRVIFFPNWTEYQRFELVTEESLESTAHRLNLDRQKKIVLYSGNIGEKQGLEIVLEAARYFSTDEDVIFLIVGDGLGKKSLVHKTASLGLSNVFFHPLQPYDLLPSLLKLADCHLIIQKRGVADAVLPSKLTNILAASGNAVITADKGSELGNLCEQYPGIAVQVEPESAKALIDGILKCLKLPKNNSIASSYAKNYLDKNSILPAVINKIHEKLG
ncbi:glycosyltransferase WbuB [Klebsiella quasipneumoniae]|nr:glycosyltransferase WbuB [Klebsiella quasipneumoniae]HBR0948041.1 glycosyltransferase WbuB [Klebsiella quasipneumoniae subsp. similipneumoniae]